jgi:hypothetical protein
MFAVAGCWPAVVGCRLLFGGWHSWILAAGGWLLAVVGCWLHVVACRVRGLGPPSPANLGGKSEIDGAVHPFGGRSGVGGRDDPR